MKIDEAVERAKFEAHIDTSPIEGVTGMLRWPDGRYQHAALQKAWNVWKAAIAAMPERDASATAPRSVEGEAYDTLKCGPYKTGRYLYFPKPEVDNWSKRPDTEGYRLVQVNPVRLYTHPAPAAVDDKANEIIRRAADAFKRVGETDDEFLARHRQQRRREGGGG